ncbi:hypothetical protein [Devosia naphthalenivorans]|uniref:hypothetical protein n=1 Tax=Devosia naphthalenivorans TaxID=2082392 RepID=UPI000D36A835|nr:hypothetical protein [Devosia naphthalenivorans]
MNWIAEHSDLINVLSNIGMLVVWITYLQVFLAGYKRQRKATILINRGGGKGLGAHCLVTNMSAGPIYIHTLIARLEGPDETIACPVTEPDDAEDWQEPSDLKLWTRQGPLESGKVRDMGTMQAIFDHVQSKRMSADAVWPTNDAKELELQVVAVYGSEDVMVAARRRFQIIHEQGERELRPLTVAAEQIRSRRERRRIVQMLEMQQTEPHT